MSLPWSIKYSPASLSGIAGNADLIAELEKFISTYKPGAKALSIEGPTGTGKTATVIALAAQRNLELVELNASDVRNEKGINATAGQASLQRSLFFDSKIILIDEVDGISGTNDRGAPGAIAELIEKSSFPVILTAISLDESKFSTLRRKCKRLEWKSPSSAEVASVLNKICEEEGVDAEQNALRQLAIRSGGDVRSAIIDLQVLAAEGKQITKTDIDSLRDRLPHAAIQSLLFKIFKSSDPKLALGALDEADEDVDESLLWIDENLPHEYTDPLDRSRAYDFLARADVFRGRIRKQQHWRYLVYVTAFMSAGVAVSKAKKNPAMREYKRAERLLSMWIANQKNASRKALAVALAPKLHVSIKKLTRLTLPSLKELARREPEFIDKLKGRYDLEDAQVAWLEK